MKLDQSSPLAKMRPLSWEAHESENESTEGSQEVSQHLEAKLRALPARPGVYLFKDREGSVIYVGKAVDLKSRVRSYFGAPSNLPSKIQRLVSAIEDLEFVITSSEQEALILECDTIKKYAPKFNASLKDNKTFPYFKIDMCEDWPGVCITLAPDPEGRSQVFWALRQCWLSTEDSEVNKEDLPLSQLQQAHRR